MWKMFQFFLQSAELSFLIWIVVVSNHISAFFYEMFVQKSSPIGKSFHFWCFLLIVVSNQKNVIWLETTISKKYQKWNIFFQLDMTFEQKFH